MFHSAIRLKSISPVLASLNHFRIFIERQTEALNQLNQVRILYNQHRNREARELLAQCPNLEEELTRISSAPPLSGRC